jgi:LytS/YehU family sensor histidine kinase
VLGSEGEWTTLGRELEVVEAYLDIERARFEERLNVTIDVPSAVRMIRIPPLVLQPLVETAVKHGIANKQAGGDVMIRARVERCPDGTHQLLVVISDSGAGSTADAVKQGRESGVGLDNVERRLACQYGPAASLSIQTAVSRGTTVEVRLPIETQAPDESDARRVMV